MHNTKECYDCKEKKPIDEFWKKKDVKDGLCNYCKSCAKIKSKLWRENNKKEITLKNKANYQKNKSERQEYNKKCYQKNKESRLTYAKNYREVKKQLVQEKGFNILMTKVEKVCSKCKQNKSITEFYVRRNIGTVQCLCKECKKQEVRQYRKDNKDKLKENRKYHKKRPTNKILTSLRNRLNKFVFLKNSKSELRDEKLGCSKKFLIDWFIYNLEFDCFDLDDFGKKWHIDHIIPCKIFNFDNQTDISSCFHWTNIKPLEKIQNLRKSSKIHWPHIFIHEIRLRAFLKLNQLNEDIFQYWLNGALATAVTVKTVM